MMRNILVVVSMMTGALLISSFGGLIHRAADSFAILRPVLGVFCIAGLFLTRPLWLKMTFGGLIALTALTVLPYFMPQHVGADVRIYSKNLGYWNVEMEGIAADIEAANVDVVMLQEVTTENTTILELLETTFPHQYLCKFTGRIGIALLSRHPFSGLPECSQRRAVLGAQILIRGRSLSVASAHIPWPWPVDSSQSEEDASTLLSKLEKPVVIAGDFNMVPWSGRVRRIAGMTETKIAGPVRPSIYVKGIPLPIDLVMAPGGGLVEYRPLFGSDHVGVIADLKVWER